MVGLYRENSMPQQWKWYLHLGFVMFCHKLSPLRANMDLSANSGDKNTETGSTIGDS